MGRVPPFFIYKLHLLHFSLSLSLVLHTETFPYIIASVSKCVTRPGFSYSPRGLLNVIIAKACHMSIMYCCLSLLAAWWFSSGDDGLVLAGSSWAGLSPSRLGWALQPGSLSHKHHVLLTHCSIEGDILYLCHTHSLMNMVISVLLWSFLEHCLIHRVHLLNLMQTWRTQQLCIIGGSNAFSLWHC